MNSKDQAKRLKAFAKKREARATFSPAADTSERERLRRECLGDVTAAILGVRVQSPSLRDTAVIEALRYECREPGAKLSNNNAVHPAILAARDAKVYDTQIWRATMKALLAMTNAGFVDEANPTQLLDLLETITH